MEAAFAHALNSIAEFSPRRLEKLRRHFGSFETAWRASSHELAAALETPEFAHAAEKERRRINLEDEQKRMEQLHIVPLLKNDPSYPEQLRHIPFPPELLYIEGVLPLPTIKPVVAVIGTRKATSYGREACRALVRPLTQAGISIISGLASGIDTESHRATLAAHGYTAAVLGSGIDRSVLYPSSNKRLADEITASGGTLISEYPPYLKAIHWTFPLRNRIIAGLSTAVLVIEARQKSGTLITVRYALEFGREVWAVPGSIFSTASETPHALIRDGAIPVTSAEDVFEALGMPHHQPQSASRDEHMPAEEQAVLQALAEPASPNNIARVLQKPIGNIQHTLALLEIHGMVRNMGNGMYRKTKAAEE